MPEQLKVKRMEGNLNARSVFEDAHPGNRVQTPAKEPVLVDNDHYFTEWKAPKNEARKVTPRCPTTPQRVKSFGSDYRKLINTPSPLSPFSQTTPINRDSSYEPSPVTPPSLWETPVSTCPMQSRISDVLDQPVIPEAINVDNDESSSDAGRRPSTTSELEDLPHGSQHSVQLKHNDQLKRRPSSRYPEDGYDMRPGSEIHADEGEHYSRYSTRRRSRAKSPSQGVTEALGSLHDWNATLISPKQESGTSTIDTLVPQYNGRASIATIAPAEGSVSRLGKLQDDPASLYTPEEGLKGPKTEERPSYFEIRSPQHPESGVSMKGERSNVGKKLLGKIRRKEHEERREEIKRRIVHPVIERLTDSVNDSR